MTAAIAISALVIISLSLIGWWVRYEVKYKRERELASLNREYAALCEQTLL